MLSVQLLYICSFHLVPRFFFFFFPDGPKVSSQTENLLWKLLNSMGLLHLLGVSDDFDNYGHIIVYCMVEKCNFDKQRWFSYK